MSVFPLIYTIVFGPKTFFMAREDEYFSHLGREFIFAEYFGKTEFEKNGEWHRLDRHL